MAFPDVIPCSLVSEGKPPPLSASGISNWGSPVYKAVMTATSQRHLIPIHFH